MNCRTNCGACCIAPSISSEIPGMPGGKPAGKRCIHLAADMSCKLFHDPRRPEVCRRFRAESEFCGSCRDEALSILATLEEESQNNVG